MGGLLETADAPNDITEDATKPAASTALLFFRAALEPSRPISAPASNSPFDHRSLRRRKSVFGPNAQNPEFCSIYEYLRNGEPACAKSTTPTISPREAATNRGHERKITITPLGRDGAEGMVTLMRRHPRVCRATARTQVDRAHRRAGPRRKDHFRKRRVAQRRGRHASRKVTSSRSRWQWSSSGCLPSARVSIP